MKTQHQWLNKYNVNGPRYTSYPTALEFNQNIAANFQQAAAKGSENAFLSLYFHVPFCYQLCYYCGCNKIVSRHQEKSEPYVDMMLQELSARKVGLDTKPINQIHFGGGTPNFLTAEQFKKIFNNIYTEFDVSDDAEISVELDVRHVSHELLIALKQCGVNRLSFGIQDTNVEVQEAINRVQPNQQVQEVFNWVRELGFSGINIDLIYGLPHQSKALFNKTLDDVLAFDPDRISLFSYAHLPQRFAAQRKIKDAWLPKAAEKLELMLIANERLSQQGGYVAVGFDHFAKASDSLVEAQNNGQLHRNFQGYTVLADSDLLALGVSSISHIGNMYIQNPKSLSDYYEVYSHLHDQPKQISYLSKPTLGHANLPTLPGRLLTHDDLIRADVIKSLMCNFSIEFDVINHRWGINFVEYFAQELSSLSIFENDGLLECKPTSLNIVNDAKLFVRNICMTFDTYLANQLNQKRFSQVV